MSASPLVRLRRQAARKKLAKHTGRLMAPLLSRDVPRKRLMRIFHEPNQNICWSQIYPFFHYADRFAEASGLSITAHSVEEFLEGTGAGTREADLVIVQPWFTIDPDRLEAAITRYRERHSNAKLIFLDSFAHSDIRLARALTGVDLYLKKDLFVDRTQYHRAFAGDTNLTEYYSALYGIPAEPVDWQVPADMPDKLALMPNFLTAPYLMDGFLGPAPDFSRASRPIDLHLRIAKKSTSAWYSQMRQHADQAAKAIPGIRLTPEERIPLDEFLDEMAQTKLCWSPHGFGELCWRDLEAFMTGSVLVKPDMSHLETRPDLYQAEVTYLPVKWDFSDLGEVVQTALADPEGCEAMARRAFELCRDYLADGQFVDDFNALPVVKAAGV